MIGTSNVKVLTRPDLGREMFMKLAQSQSKNSSNEGLNVRKEREREIAKRIEDARSKVYSRLFANPYSSEKLVELGKRVGRGEELLRDIVLGGEALSHDDLLHTKERFSRITLEDSQGVRQSAV